MSKRVAFNPSGLKPPKHTYSWAVKKGNMVFLAGAVPFDKDKNIVGTDLRTQLRQCLENLDLAVRSAGGSLDDICSVTVYSAALDFEAINDVYAQFFPTDPPARVCVQVGLPLIGGVVLIEVSAIAVLD